MSESAGDGSPGWLRPPRLATGEDREASRLELFYDLAYVLVVRSWPRGEGDTAPLHMEHLPERFGLFVILVLGELVAGIVTGVHDAGWAPASVTVGAIGFAVAAALWWSYLDVASASGNEQLQDGSDDTDERHDLYVYGHLPLTLGIATSGVGIEELVLHPTASLPSAAGTAAIAGVAMFLFGAGVVVAGAHRRLSAMWPWPVAALAPLPVLGFLRVAPLVLVSLLALAAVTVAVVGSVSLHRRGQDRSGQFSTM